MKDVVFSCPACKKPLKVEESAAGTPILCPLCHADIQVPPLKTAVWAPPGRRHKERPSETRLKMQISDVFLEVSELGDSLRRKVSAQEKQIGVIAESAALTRQRASILEQCALPAAEAGDANRAEREALHGPIPSSDRAWRSLTLGFGLLAFLLALALALMAG